MQRNIEKRYPPADSNQELANAFADFFSAKIVRIRDELLVRKEQMGECTMEEMISVYMSCFSEFEMVINDDVLRFD